MRILSLDGGGYLGLATASFLEETERHFGRSFHSSFDMFCGTSTGAIIALALASGMSGREVVALYEGFGRKVFGKRSLGSWFRRAGKGVLVSKYSNQALRAALTEAFGETTLGDIKAKEKSVLVTAFSVTTGKPRVFKTDHSEDLTRDDGYLLRDVALASAAAPIYFPVVSLSSPVNHVDERYCDGGVFANHPALLGYAEAVSHLGIASSNVHILSISTPRGDLSEQACTRSSLQQYFLSRGLISWGTKLAGVMIDSTSIIAHETLRRILSWRGNNGARYVRILLEKPSGLGMDVATRKSTDTLRQLGSEKAFSTEIRNQIAHFFRP
jgi:patatin-like phospholipase/acyl hydrolase